jgi:hypothetical protein
VLGVPVVSYWNGDMTNHMKKQIIYWYHDNILSTYYNKHLSHTLTYNIYILLNI